MLSFAIKMDYSFASIPVLPSTICTALVVFTVGVIWNQRLICRSTALKNVYPETSSKIMLNPKVDLGSKGKGPAASLLPCVVLEHRWWQ